MFSVSMRLCHAHAPQRNSRLHFTITKFSTFLGFATENTLSDLKLAAGTGKMTLTPCSPYLQ